MNTTLAERIPNDPLAIAEHHSVWCSVNRRTNATEACRDYNEPVLLSLLVAYMHERDAPSRHTVSSYRASVARFVRWARETGASLYRPDKTAGTRFRAYLQGEYHTPGSVNTRLTGAARLYAALDWADVDAVNPFVHVSGVKDKRPPHLVRDRYSDAEIRKLLDHANDATDRAIILLGVTAGLRLNEMLTLTWPNVRLPERDATGTWRDAGEADVIGKGDRPATIDLGDDLMDALVQLDTPRDGFVLPVRSASGVRHRLALMATRAGIVNDPRAKRPTQPNGRRLELGVHRLRHAFGSRIVLAEGIAVGQEALRHASPTTTSRYAKGRRDRVASFVRGLHWDAPAADATAH